MGDEKHAVDPNLLVRFTAGSVLPDPDQIPMLVGLATEDDRRLLDRLRGRFRRLDDDYALADIVQFRITYTWALFDEPPKGGLLLSPRRFDEAVQDLLDAFDPDWNGEHSVKQSFADRFRNHLLRAERRGAASVHANLSASGEATR